MQHIEIDHLCTDRDPVGTVNHFDTLPILHSVRSKVHVPRSWSVAIVSSILYMAEEKVEITIEEN